MSKKKYTKINTQPPDYIPTELEHKAAYRKYCLDHIFYNELLRLKLLDEGVLTKGDTEERKNSIKKRINTYLEHYEEEAWENIISYAEFKKDFSEHLKDEHCGDCVCKAVTCIRCYAEDMYDLESTVDWCRCWFYIYNDHKCEEHKDMFIK